MVIPQDIKKDTTHYKCFPMPVIKKITQDLIRLDSCTENLNKTNQELSEVYEKVTLKDSIISDMKTKEVNYLYIIDNERSKNLLSENRVRKLEFDLGIEKNKNKLISTLSGGFILILTGILLFKH